MTPTARSLEYLIRAGFIATVVERWLPHCHVRRDAFGFADILAAMPVLVGPSGQPACPNCGNSSQNGIPADAPLLRRCATCKTVWQPGGALLVQTTTTANQAARFKKILASTEARRWLQAGNRISVHGWHKSAKTNRWQVTEREVTLADWEEEEKAS